MSDLRLGDCLEILPLVPDGSVDLIIDDPPYGKRFHDGLATRGSSPRWKNPPAGPFGGSKIVGDHRPDVRCVADMARILKRGGALYLFSQWMVEDEWKAAIKAAGLRIRNRLIWVKAHHGAGDLATTYGPKHESILYATKGRHTLRGRRDSDVWVEPFGRLGTFAGRIGKRHPNEKPLDLITWLIGKSSDEGDTVLDPHMGSGTTGEACKRSGRRFIGIEIDPTHYAVASNRIEGVGKPAEPLPLFAE